MKFNNFILHSTLGCCPVYGLLC